MFVLYTDSSICVFTDIENPIISFSPWGKNTHQGQNINVGYVIFCYPFMCIESILALQEKKSPFIQSLCLIYQQWIFLAIKCNGDFFLTMVDSVYNKRKKILHLIPTLPPTNSIMNREL